MHLDFIAHVCIKLFLMQFRGWLFIPNMSGEFGSWTALITQWLHPCQQRVSENEEHTRG